MIFISLLTAKVKRLGIICVHVYIWRKSYMVRRYGFFFLKKCEWLLLGSEILFLLPRETHKYSCIFFYSQ